MDSRRSFKYLKIVLKENEVAWSRRIRYIGVQLDRKLSFGEHIQIAMNKASRCGANLARLVPNIGDPREAQRKLVASMVH